MYERQVEAFGAIDYIYGGGGIMFEYYWAVFRYQQFMTVYTSACLSLACNYQDLGK